MLLIGDVALAHDVGGLLAARRLGLKLVIVLIDNDGGGIFHFLPAASQGEDFVEHIATPHGLDFAHAAALYGVAYERAADVDTFRAALHRAVAADHTHDHLRAHRPRAQRRPAPARLGVRPGRHVASRGGWPTPLRRPCSRWTPPRPRRAGRRRRASPRATSCEVDKKGRRFHALVKELAQLESGRFELVLRPLDSRISWRTASVREVVDVWRRAGRPD